MAVSRFLTTAALAAIWVGTRQSFAATPVAPNFPDSYEVRYTLVYKEEASWQEGGLQIPVRVVRDASKGFALIDVSNNTRIYRADATYYLHPRGNTSVCTKVKRSKELPPTWGLNVSDVMPEGPWTYVGTAIVQGVECNRFSKIRRTRYEGTRKELLVVTQGGEPKQYLVKTYDADGVRTDSDIFEFQYFKAGVPKVASLFQPPQSCRADAPAPAPSRAPAPAPGRAPAPAPGGSDLSSGFMTALGDYLALQDLQDQIRQSAGGTSRTNVQQLVRSWNGLGGTTFRLKANRFSAWIQGEFESIMLPLLNDPKFDNGTGPTHHRSELPYEPLLPPGGVIPDSLDLRNTSAVGPVKNQRDCGSCWAFAVAGLLQGAYGHATGKRVIFSVQQQMDCASDFGPHACQGGFPQDSLDYLLSAGGIAGGDAYPYVRNANFCRAPVGSNTTNSTGVGNAAASARNSLPLTPFKGYARVPKGRDRDVMAALVTRGPLAATLDASSLSFRFYDSGVLTESSCNNTKFWFSHAVLIVGYGTEDGVDYWLLQNSWGIEWGDSGYIKVARGDLDCGLTVSPYYAIMDGSVAPAMAPGAMAPRRGAHGTAAAPGQAVTAAAAPSRAASAPTTFSI